MLKIGLCYDTKETYGLKDDNYDYTDFVSLETVSSVKNAISNCGYYVELIGNIERIKEILPLKPFPYDLIFNISEGFNSRNRESLIPALLEAFNIPFTGSDVYPMSITSNKYHTKIIAEHLGVPTPKYCLICDGKILSTDLVKFKYPIVVKPVNEGGSMGVHKVLNRKDLKEMVEKLYKKYKCDILCESYVSGKELTVPIIGNKTNSKALSVVLMTEENGMDIELYTYEHKRYDNIENTIFDSLEEETYQSILEDSVMLHRHFGLQDYSRVDYRMDKEGNYYFLEINQLPSLIRYGSFEISANQLDLDYDQIIDQIIKACLERYNINL